MKKDPPNPEAMEIFARLKLTFLAFVVPAIIVWEVQDFAASLAAVERTTQTTLRTTDERDDASVLRAWAQARRTVRATATLETERNPQQQTRDARLTVTTPSKAETLAGREALVSAIKTAFAQEGPGELYDIGNKPSAQPVQNRAYRIVRQTCRWGALAVFFAGLAFLAVRWKSSRLPPGALLGILATAFFIFLQILGDEGAGIWGALVLLGPPGALLTLVFVIMRRVRRAAAWVEGRARITRSEVEVERHRFSGDTTKVRNLPAVAYEFDSPIGPTHGDRISLGEAPADNVDKVLQRYPVGATVPVFYDPANPRDCVLERTAPASAGCFWGGTAFLVIGYLAVVLSFWNVLSISAFFDTAFPRLHHPLIVAIAGALGLFCLAAGLWNMRHPRLARPWLRTTGTIVTSTTEEFRDTATSHSTRTCYRPVIEYRYRVGPQEYHGTVGNSAVTVSISSGKAQAEAAVARYPAGLEVEVFYDPQNHAQSGLDVDTGMMLDGRASLIVALVLLAIAAYAARH